MANSIADQIGEDDPLSTIATTLVAYAFSSVLTGKILGSLYDSVCFFFLPRSICAILRHILFKTRILT